MIQKKVCMVGAFGVGKTSLVARFVKSIFSDKYLTTLGVKIDKKALNIGGQELTLMLWDLAGEDALTQVKSIQLRGSSGYILVADGCRASTLEAAIDIQSRVEAELGKVPFTCVVNKADLRENWEVDAAALERLSGLGWSFLLTSAKTGEGVEALFEGLAVRMLRREGRPWLNQAKSDLHPDRDQRADAAAILLSAMQFVVFERDGLGRFDVINEYPEWFLRLVPIDADADVAPNLTEHFPALESFLPIAEQFWATGSLERLQSDFWTETDSEGNEYHLLALAVTTGRRQFLVIERADATYIGHQQLQLYAHEMVMQT